MAYYRRSYGRRYARPTTRRRSYGYPARRRSYARPMARRRPGGGNGYRTRGQAGGRYRMSTRRYYFSGRTL